MSLDELGSIGELIAAAATVATLVYLALQIRQNTQTLRHASAQAHLQNMQHAASMIGSSSETASVWQRGMENFSRLAPNEQAQFTAIVLSIYNASDASYTNYRLGAMPEDGWRREFGVLRLYVRSNGGRHVWNIAKALQCIGPDFISFVETELEATKSEVTPGPALPAIPEDRRA